VADAHAQFTRVGIDGVDGAGKTVLGDELAQELARRGLSVVRVSIDGFHHPKEHRYRRGRDDPEGFFRDSYDYARFRALVLDSFAPGGSGVYVATTFDSESNRVVTVEPAQAPPRAVLIVDGIFLHRPELADAWDYSIWLEVPFDVSVPRGAQRGYGDPDPAAATNRRYVEGQRIYIAECDPARRATVRIDNTDLDAPRIL
jgi:uridine kinase